MILKLLVWPLLMLWEVPYSALLHGHKYAQVLESPTTFVLVQFNNASLVQHMIAIRRTPTSLVTLLTLSVVDSVEMVSLYTQIHPSQNMESVMKFHRMLLTNVTMQVFSLTSQVREFRCIQLPFLTQESVQVQWLLLVVLLNINFTLLTCTTQFSMVAQIHQIAQIRTSNVPTWQNQVSFPPSRVTHTLQWKCIQAKKCIAQFPVKLRMVLGVVKPTSRTLSSLTLLQEKMP